MPRCEISLERFPRVSFGESLLINAERVIVLLAASPGRRFPARAAFFDLARLITGHATVAMS
jgi:hypothetical protein